MSKIEVDAIEPQSGTTLTIGASGDTITIPSGATLTNNGTATGFGKVLQVVSTTKTDTYTEDVSANSLSTNLVTGLQPSITPSSASNKILILININIGYESANVGDAPGFLLRRSNTGIAKGDTAGDRTSMTQLSWLGSTDQMVSTSMNFLDSPNTTSSTTYAISLFNGSGSSRNVRINRTHSDADFNYRARTISTITLIEIKG
jgi:hypothetical protein